MEDEECLPENGSLKSYLQNLGYSDVHVTKNVTLNQNSLKFEITKTKGKTLKVESIDEEVIDQIGILISTQMLFEEDISNVEKVLSSFKVVKNGMMKSMFQGFFGIIVMFVGLCLYWVIGSYAFIIVSAFYAYKVAHYLERRHFNQNRLKKLTTILQTNFSLLKKAIKFIEENNKLIQSQNEIVQNKTVHLMEGFDYYENFKSDFLISVNEMISIFMKGTQKLIKAIPLCDYMETPEYYLCNNFKSNNECADFSKLYQIYLLMQSEFLQRLSLSLIPNINLSKDNSFKELNSILTEACVHLLKIKNKLNKKFKFIFLNGIYCSDKKFAFKLPSKTKEPGINYKDELVSGIHETGNTFQNLLIKSRILENAMTSDNIPDNLENELLNMQNDLNSCQRNISDSFILLKKANAIRDVPEVVKLPEEFQEPEEKQEKIFVGYTDLDPKIEDEIFEAYFADEKLNGDLCVDDWDFDDRLKKKLEKEYSKSVIEELKIKLVEKAKNWERREAEVMKKKGIIINKEEMEQNDDLKNLPNDDCDDAEEEKLQLKSEQQIIEDNYNDTHFKNLNNDEITASVQSNYSYDDCPQNCLQGMNKAFLSDLSEARQRILKTAVEEELYCCSGEESCEEDC